MVRNSILLDKSWMCFDNEKLEAHNKLNSLSGRPPIKHGKTNVMYHTGHTIELHNNVYIVKYNSLVLSRETSLLKAKNRVLKALGYSYACK